MQCIVTSRSCLLLGSPRIAGPSDSVTKKSELGHSVSLCLQERVTTPSCFIVVPLHACSMVCLFFVVPSAGYALGASFSGNIRRNIRSGRMFPCAPVSTFTLRDAGRLYWMSRCTGCKVRHGCHRCSSRWTRIQGIPVRWQHHHRCRR